MPLFKILFLSLFLPVFSFNAQANHSQFKEPQNIIVLKHNYSLEDCLDSSIAHFHKVTTNLLYLQDEATLKLLEDNAVITIPNMAQSSLVFQKNKFRSANFQPVSLEHGTSLDLTVKKIIEIRESLQPINHLAIVQSRCNLSNLTARNLEKKNSIITDSYELENYRIELVLKKISSTRELHPQKQDNFQLELIVDAKDKATSHAIG